MAFGSQHSLSVRQRTSCSCLAPHGVATRLGVGPLLASLGVGGLALSLDGTSLFLEPQPLPPQWKVPQWEFVVALGVELMELLPFPGLAQPLFFQ